MEIEISDGSGAGALTTTITVIVELDDLNDNSPIFSPASYPFSVNEDEAVGYVVGTVTASDLDVTVSLNTISYTLSDSNFDVDLNNGDVYITSLLDHDTTRKT